MAANNQTTGTDIKEKSPIQRRFPVALNRAPDSSYNTIVLGGLDLIIPLEIDLDKDPTEPDEIRLQSAGRWYESHVKSDDPEVEPDGENPLLLYPFRDVPPGIYTISVKVGGKWRDVLTGFRVTRDGVFYGEESIERTPDGSVLGTPIKETELIEEEEDEYFEDYDKYICEA